MAKCAHRENGVRCQNEAVEGKLYCQAHSLFDLIQVTVVPPKRSGLKQTGGLFRGILGSKPRTERTAPYLGPGQNRTGPPKNPSK
jgi:hypothetical protein